MKTRKPKLSAKATAKIEASAKVSIQRKKMTTEVIPPDVTRAKAARWLDLISPITEWAGLKGDSLRHQREQLRIQQDASLIALGSRIREKMGGKSPDHKLPPKIFVPALEAASLEDAESPLIEWWADLLVSGTKTGHSRPIFTDIIKSIGPHEVSFLERIWAAANTNPDKEFLDIFHYRPDLAQALDRVISSYEDKAQSLFTRPIHSVRAREINDMLGGLLAALEGYACPGSGAFRFEVPIDGTIRSFSRISHSLWYDQPVEFRRPDALVQLGRLIESSLDICISLSLVRAVSGSRTMQFQSVGEVTFSFSGYQLTNLGVEFLAAVHPVNSMSWSQNASARKAD